MRYVSKKPKTQLCPRCREPVDSGHCACTRAPITQAEAAVQISLFDVKPVRRRKS